MSESELLDLIVGCRKGSVVAPAGCGKTEQIARAALHGRNRRLILTHTLAGVDALRSRFRSKGASSEEHEVNTIAAWSLRIAGAFPMRSSISVSKPSGDEWELVYAAAERLITAGCIKSVLTSSYSGVFVDEYQDCTQLQHKLICALADILPCCIFGDPLQAIFDFNGDMPDWDHEVLKIFPTIFVLEHPYRWHKVGNAPLGDWLLACRRTLEQGKPIDLQSAPRTVYHRKLQAVGKNERYQEKTKFVMQALARSRVDKCIVIGDSRNENIRAALARKVWATAIEPVTCKRLTAFVDELNSVEGFDRLEVTLDFMKSIMLKAHAAPLKKTVQNITLGKRRQKPPNELESSCLDITRSNSLSPILNLLQKVPLQGGGWIYRRELYYCICGALQDTILGLQPSLADAVWDVQNRRRHSGRRLGNRNIGSTLLVKGLEFDHAIVVDLDTFRRNDLYVALTRGSQTLTVISESPLLHPRHS
jgi:DNA helicase-2/ATP-dependent DNA helicase PcrA